MSIKAFIPSGGPSLVALATVESPEPSPGDALVAVEAFSVNRGEILLLQGGRTDPPGKDVAGRIARAAADGSGPPLGARVVAHIDGGAWSELAAVPGDRAVELPGEVSSDLAAALPLAGLTALRLLRAAGELPGRRVLLTGASGGVGHFVVDLAAAAGARVTAVVSSPSRGERLAALGAEAVVTSVEQAVGPFDIAMESVGGRGFGQALLKLSRGGLLLWFGQASLEPVVADFFAVQKGPRDVTIRTFNYWVEAERDAEDLATLVKLVADGRLHPEIGAIADWAETPRVLAELRDRKVRGNAVLRLPQLA